MQIALIIITVFLVIIFIVRTRAIALTLKAPLPADHPKVVTLTDHNFIHQVKGKVMLVDFWADWCAPCRMMAPVLNELADGLSGNAQVGKVNIQLYQSIAEKYKVRNIPTLLVLKDGLEVNRFVGIKTKDFLKKELEKING